MQGTDQLPFTDDYPDKETARRRDEALRRALNTPPKPSPNPKAVKRSRDQHKDQSVSDA